MITKMIQTRVIGERNKCGRREEDLHPLLQEVTHLARVAMRPEKEKEIKRNTEKAIEKKETKFFCQNSA